jgi:hypothetical protein
MLTLSLFYSSSSPWKIPTRAMIVPRREASNAWCDYGKLRWLALSWRWFSWNWMRAWLRWRSRTDSLRSNVGSVTLAWRERELVLSPQNAVPAKKVGMLPTGAYRSLQLYRSLEVEVLYGMVPTVGRGDGHKKLCYLPVEYCMVDIGRIRCGTIDIW